MSVHAQGDNDLNLTDTLCQHSADIWSLQPPVFPGRYDWYSDQAAAYVASLS